MLQQPRFKPHLRVQVVPGEGVFVLSGAHQALLRGRLYELVAPRVGGHSADEVCNQLQDQASPAEVYFILGQLEHKGYLCETDESLPPSEAALWWVQEIDPRAAVERLAQTPVTVRAFGVDAAPLRELLQSLHVRVEENGALGVVMADGYLRRELAAYNAEALRDGRPWLLVRPVGQQVWVGPLFRPGVTGCWECLAQRLRANCPVEAYVESRNGSTGAVGERACTPATLHVAWGLAANAVATWVARGELSSLEGKLQTYDVPSWQAGSHTLVRLPYCPACGSGAVASDRPLRPPALQSSVKTFTGDGGHRVVAPEATLQRYGHHVSPITGAVTMLERVKSTGDGVMHVYIAGHNLARQHHSLDHLRADLRHMSSGKGATDVQARASGLCEGLERYSAVFRGDEPRRRARLAELGGSAVHPHDCLLFSERQYRERDVWNARKSHYNFVPLPFDADAEIEWTPAWSLTRREPRISPGQQRRAGWRATRSLIGPGANANWSAPGSHREIANLPG
jgi:ribosomal protein S12 methylthiotransferase accessory factor